MVIAIPIRWPKTTTTMTMSTTTKQIQNSHKSSKEESEDFASDVFPPRLLVIHDPGRCRHHDETELSGGKEIRRQVHHNFACSVIIDAFKLADVSVLHHHRQKLDDDFGVGADENLSFATLLRIVNRLQGVGQNVHAHHFLKSSKI